MSVSPADSNRSIQPAREFNAQTGTRKSNDAAAARHHDVPRVGHAVQERQRTDFEGALRRAADEEASDDEAALEAAMALPGPLPQPQHFVARMQSGDVPSAKADSRIASGLRTQDAALLRQTAVPLVAGNATHRLQLEFADAGVPLQRIELERTPSGCVDVAVTTTCIRGPLGASVARLRTRLVMRGTALGCLHVKQPDSSEDETSHLRG
ncbi:MAG: hypothetical protein JF606_09890 [Burkholderiales bacterium]|nr:hypothetical protein [Burkholderiales bacterium]